jgi:hypothetical protein
MTDRAMDSAIRAGRIVGVLILIQMAGGIVLNFNLESPLFGTPGFLIDAASHARQLGLAAMLGLATEALWVAIAITAFPIFKQHSLTLALWLVVLAGVLLALAVVENAAVMSMVSVSEAYANANAAVREQLQAIRVVVASARNWPHFMARAFDGVTIFTLYIALYRFRLVPRLLAGFGLIAAASQIAGVAMPLFGHDVIFPMLAPLGLVQLILSLWLIAKGFAGQQRQTENAAPSLRG